MRRPCRRGTGSAAASCCRRCSRSSSSPPPATLAGALILRRRGVYFSLLTLALTALLFAIAYRWTDFTGGESGLGGVTRATVLGVDLERDGVYYGFVAAVGFVVVFLLWRFHRSPVGHVLVAIRENEQRARFVGYPTNRYKLLGFVISASVVGIAGILSVFNHRFASAEPLAVAFSGELIAMVVIGGMRSFLGPALGALFFILFREFLSIWTPSWLFYFGLLFVGFILFSPTGLVGVAQRLVAPFRRTVFEEAAMAGRTLSDEPLPPFLVPSDHGDGAVLEARGIAKSFGALKAVAGVDIRVRDRALHALIGPNGAGKTTAFNLISGLFTPDEGDVVLRGRSVAGLSPERITEAGIGRSFQITNLFPALSVEENLRLAVQARHPRRFDPWTAARSLDDVERETAALIRYLGVAGMERGRGGRFVLWRPAPPRHGAGAGDEAARPAPRRASGRPVGGRAPAHRRHRQAHLLRHSRAPRRARHRPRVPDRRRGHRHERRPGAGRRQRRGRALEREGAGGLYRLGRGGAGGEAPRERRRAGNPPHGGGHQHLLRQEPHPGGRVVHRARA